MARDRFAERKASFKKTFMIGDGRRRREETQIQIRRIKKDAHMAKRRHAATASAIVPTNASPQVVRYTFNDLPRLVGVLSAGNSSDGERLEAVVAIRRMISVEGTPPVDKVVDAGALSFLVQCLSRDDMPKLQFEAAWALTNVASTSRTALVVSAGAVPHMIRLLNSTEPDCREQAVWCLGNIAGDCNKFRDMILQAEGAVNLLICNLKQPASASLANNTLWAVSNLCRGKPGPDLDIIRPFLEVIAFYLENRQDPIVTKDALVDCLWALSYISDGANERIRAVVAAGVVPHVTGLLDSDSSRNLLAPAVRTLGNIVTGNATLTQAVIDAGIMKYAKILLDHPARNIRREACWLFSNICAGTPSQVTVMFKNPNILNRLVSAAQSSEWEVRKEALYALANIFTGGTDEQVLLLVQIDDLQAICSALSVQDTGVVLAAMDAIVRILSVGAKHNKDFITRLDEQGAIDTIENLQEHKSQKVYDQAVYIIQEFFGKEEEEDENMMPSSDGNSFSFGFHTTPKDLFGAGKQESSSPIRFSFGGDQSMNASKNLFESP